MNAIPWTAADSLRLLLAFAASSAVMVLLAGGTLWVAS